MAEATGREHLTPAKITSTSATERASFRSCRRRWLLTTVHRLDLEEGSTALFLGTLFHAGLEAYYKGLKRGYSIDVSEEEAMDAYQAAYDAEVGKVRGQLGFTWKHAEPLWRDAGVLGFEMVQNYLEQERRYPLLDEVLSVEVRVNVPIRSPKGRKVGILSVQTDVVGLKNGQMVVVDHKSASRDYPESMMELDDQHTAEAYAVWKSTGRFPDEVVRNIAKKKVPEPPRLINKGKALSKAKSLDTTVELYEQAIADNGFDRMDYADHIQWLREQSSRFFARPRTFRSPDQMASFEANLYQEWRDMKSVAAHPERAYPNPSQFNCPSCPVRLVCMAIQDGNDVETIITQNYVIGEPRR